MLKILDRLKWRDIIQFNSENAYGDSVGFQLVQEAHVTYFNQSAQECRFTQRTHYQDSWNFSRAFRGLHIFARFLQVALFHFIGSI